MEKASSSATLRPADGAFFGSLKSDAIAAGDRVEVRDLDTQHVETMTVQPWAVRFDGDTRRLTGSSANGFVALIRELGCLAGYFLSDPPQRCEEGNAPGKFDLSFEGAELAGLSAELSLRGTDGHYTQGGAAPFQVGMNTTTYYFGVTTETHNSSVTATLHRNGVSWPLYCTEGYCSASRSPFLNPPLPGDVVDIKTSDGDAVSLQIPVFTVEGAGLPPGVYGKAPAGVSIVTALNEAVRYRESGRYFTSETEYAHALTFADAAGRYFASYAGQQAHALTSLAVCRPVKPDSPCAYMWAGFCTPDGDSFYTERRSSGGLYCDPPHADSFEEDDTRDQAAIYRSPQHHTFDRGGDVDWLRFDVPQSAVAGGATYRFETYNLAYGAIHEIALYDVGNVPLLEWRVESMDAQPTAKAWQPVRSGTYYLQVRRPPALDSVYCGDVYDLRIWAGDPQPAYLPMISQ